MPTDWNDPDAKAALEEAVRAANAPLEDSIQKLEAKNSELREEKRKARAEAKQLAEAAESLKREANAAGTALAEKEGDAKTVRQRLESSFAEREAELARRAETAEAQAYKLLVDNGLTEALASGTVRVAPEMLRAVKALIKAEHKVEVADGVAQIGNLPLDEFIADWKQSDTGRHFIAARVNGGGGALNTGGARPTDNPWKRETRNLSAQGRILREDPALAAQLKSEAGA